MEELETRRDDLARSATQAVRRSRHVSDAVSEWDRLSRAAASGLVDALEALPFVEAVVDLAAEGRHGGHRPVHIRVTARGGALADVTLDQGDDERHPRTFDGEAVRVAAASDADPDPATPTTRKEPRYEPPAATPAGRTEQRKATKEELLRLAASAKAVTVTKVPEGLSAVDFAGPRSKGRRREEPKVVDRRELPWHGSGPVGGTRSNGGHAE